MISFLYQRFYKRMLFGIAAGIAGYLLIILTFSLQYRYYSIPLDLLDFLSFMVFGVVMTELLVRTNRKLDRKVTWVSSPVKRVAIQALTGLLLAFLVIVVLRLSVILLFFPDRLIILSDEVVIFLVVFFSVLVFDLVELGIFLNRNYRNSLAELERFRKENAEYQFEMLKLQLNPHFLFNSLNTLSSLVYDDADKASEFIRRLSEVYRYVLDNRSKELVSIRQELGFINSFTYLLGIRFQGMVHFKVEVRDEDLDKQIPPMTVQLLVENAVKHNVASRQRPLTITISTDNQDLWVINNLQLKGNNENTGVGLKNIKSRYGFLTDREVEILKDEKAFTVKVPLI